MSLLLLVARLYIFNAPFLETTRLHFSRSLYKSLRVRVVDNPPLQKSWS